MRYEKKQAIFKEMEEIDELKDASYINFIHSVKTDSQQYIGSLERGSCGIEVKSKVNLYFLNFKDSVLLRIGPKGNCDK